MERETDQYMNADEYVQELLINVRSLAGEYLNWKKQSVFAGEGRIRDTEVSREGILELSQILRRGKHSFEEMHRKAEQSVRRRTVIPLEYLFHIKKAGKYLKHCVSLALAAELDRNSGELFQEIPENYKKIYPTLELGLCLYTADSRVRIECMRNMLEEKETFDFFFGTGNSRESRTEMRLDPRILQFLLSPETEPEKLEGFCRLYDGSDLEEQPMVIREEQMERTAALLGTVSEEKKILYLFGHPGSGRRFMIRHACRKLGRFCLEADIGKLDGNDPGKLLDEMIRETQIRRAVLCIRNFHLLFQNGKMYQALGVVEKILMHLPQVILLADQTWPYSREEFPAPVTELEISPPDIGERITLWEEALRQHPEAMPETFQTEHARLEILAGKFTFHPGQIMSAAAETSRSVQWTGKRAEEEDLYRACRHQVSHRLGERAMQIEPAYGWDDLILPPDRKQMLRNACDQIEYSHQVYGKWGFASKMVYGKGVSMLFYGPPGTGKTMGAQVLARELHLELYKADLSSVMSKYIGETEKNLGEIFEEVKKSQSILFFDEADALFGKRSEVKDAQDKYANAEAAYLLQKMEEYEGIVILATNYIQNFDEAFKRRIRFMIEFPLPDAKRRLKIWSQVYPRQTPVSEDVDFEFLAGQFELSGSSIKNIAVSAAFRAAAAGTEVEMEQILNCLKEEMKKSGKNLQREDFGPYYSLMNREEDTSHAII